MKDKRIRPKTSRSLLRAIRQVINEVEHEKENEIRTKINDLFWSDLK